VLLLSPACSCDRARRRTAACAFRTIEALERTVGFIETTAREHGVDAPLQASFGVADGDSLWAVRYASEGVPRSLFASSDVEAIQRLHSDNPRLQRLSPGDRLIVSEPVNELPGLWHEIEPSTAVTVRRGGVLEHRPFRPRPEGPPLIVRQFAGTADG
jgi:predicted glutamine amidotransferase